MIILKCDMWSVAKFSTFVSYFKVQCSKLVETSDFITVRILQFRSLPHGHKFTTRGTQIPGATSPWRINFVRWRIIFVDPRYRPGSMSSIWRLESWGGSYIFRKFVHPSSLEFIIHLLSYLKDVVHSVQLTVLLNQPHEIKYGLSFSFLSEWFNTKVQNYFFCKSFY
jgi:hypothetical protein